jgi:hypothetical protein
MIKGTKDNKENKLYFETEKYHKNSIEKHNGPREPVTYREFSAWEKDIEETCDSIEELCVIFNKKYGKNLTPSDFVINKENFLFSLKKFIISFFRFN